MKEIHFKILYNILPVRKNLLKWNLASDDTRNTLVKQVKTLFVHLFHVNVIILSNYIYVG